MGDSLKEIKARQEARKRQRAKLKAEKDPRSKSRKEADQRPRAGDDGGPGTESTPGYFGRVKRTRSKG